MLKAMIVYTVWNVVAFSLMGLDKARARKHLWRVRERSLFLMALALGGIGIWTGMYFFRHKTKHAAFTLGIPVLCAGNAIFLYYCLV
ncbi:MAG TPA: DUF1294 domain-containing protein [Patescibacteria group bacterium]|nr:DUF1294 domain-containing protein [Patescibacteria group bacterium]